MLNRLYLRNAFIEHQRHPLVHLERIIAGHEARPISVSLHQSPELVLRDPCEHCWIGDLVTVEVEDWQNCAVRYRIQKLVRMPARSQRTGFSLAVADYAAHNQVWIVEGSTECVR
jgi:hypothetical protein